MLKASALEFRFRFLILAFIYVLGFTAPWNHWLHLDSIRTWQLLAAWPARSGWITFSAATLTVLALGILCALLAATLRTWASAYLGASIVQDGAMHGDGVVAAGPYRYLRNPLYLGTFIHTFALALLMPPTGAIFSILAIGLFQLRLIGGEQAFLTAKLGEPYRAYCARVPSLLPALTPRVPASATRPTWPTAFLGAIYYWGVAISFAALGWRYNAFLIIQGVVISLGVSLIARVFIPKR
jgi:protein-S-isoprenylcysteine O-methyltransferase Ste14